MKKKIVSNLLLKCLRSMNILLSLHLDHVSLNFNEDELRILIECLDKEDNNGRRFNERKENK